MVTPAPSATNSLLNSVKRHGNRVPLILLIVFICFLAIFLLANGGYSKKLQFASSGSYKIAIFADLHYGENAWTDWGPLQDQKSNVVISNVLDRENPDFVVYLGDLLTANNLPTRNATLYWDQAISPTKSKKIPWASVFGNHDDMAFEWPLEWFGSSGMPSIFCPDSSLASAGRKLMTDCYFQGTTRAELIKNEVQNDLSHSSYGPKGLWPSVSNYVIEIASYKHSELPAAFLYFLDSGGGSYPEVISASQASWFQQTSAQWNPGARVPEVVFWHIPSQAYKQVAPPPRSPINQPCVGSINLESVASQEAEWGIMDILTNGTSVKVVIVGHNHGLDWCCPHKSLWLCFARHTGYGGYGNWPRGARILELVEEPFAMKSWIRMEDGTRHSQVTLAS